MKTNYKSLKLPWWHSLPDMEKAGRKQLLNKHNVTMMMKRYTCPFSLACQNGGRKTGKEEFVERETSEVRFELLPGVI